MCGRDTEVVIRVPILFRLQKASVWETSYQGFGPEWQWTTHLNSCSDFNQLEIYVHIKYCDHIFPTIILTFAFILSANCSVIKDQINEHIIFEAIIQFQLPNITIAPSLSRLC